MRWFEATVVEQPDLLALAHPARDRIDRVPESLVGNGVAEAHELKLRGEMGSSDAPAMVANQDQGS